jgi:hypothetical protein
MEQDGHVLVDELLGDRRHGRDGLRNLLGEEWPHVALDELEEHRHEVLNGFLEVWEEELFVVHRLNGRRSLPGHRATSLLVAGHGLTRTAERLGGVPAPAEPAGRSSESSPRVRMAKDDAR